MIEVIKRHLAERNMLKTVGLSLCYLEKKGEEKCVRAAEAIIQNEVMDVIPSLWEQVCLYMMEDPETITYLGNLKKEGCELNAYRFQRILLDAGIDKVSDFSYEQVKAVYFDPLVTDGTAYSYMKYYGEQNVSKEEKEKLQNAIADQEMLHEINYLNIDKTNYEYLGKPRKRQKPKLVNGVLVYNRDRQIALNALLHAGFLCEINKEHPSFIRKNSEKKYMECHHLVPLSYSYKFPDISLDVEENIVCLCSNCHNQLHYGKGADVLLKKLYLERHSYLEKVGIHITLNELLEMYEV